MNKLKRLFTPDNIFTIKSTLPSPNKFMNECKRDEYIKRMTNFCSTSMLRMTVRVRRMLFRSFYWNQFFSVVFSFVEVVGFSLVVP